MYLNFFKYFERYSSFLFSSVFCPSNISISSMFYHRKATFRFFFRAKISGFAFSLTSKRSLQVCVVHVPIPCSAQRPVADDVALQLHLCNAERTTAKKSEMCWYKRKFLNFFFFLSKQTCSFGCALTVALLLRLFGGERQGSVVRPFLASSPLSIVKVDISEISKPPTGLPHPEK